MCANSGAGTNLGLQDFRPLDAHGWQAEAHIRASEFANPSAKRSLVSCPASSTSLPCARRCTGPKLLLNASYNCQVAVQTKASN